MLQLVMLKRMKPIAHFLSGQWAMVIDEALKHLCVVDFTKFQVK